MKEIWAKFKEWWINLSVREKQGVTIGSVVLSIFVVYQFIWQPAINHVETMRSRIDKDQKMLLWMEVADKEIQKMEKESRKNSKTTSPVVLMGLLQKQIDNVGLKQYLTQLKQASHETIAIHFQKVDFDKLVRLLATILKEGNISITQMTAIADNSPGVVSADVILKIE